MIYTLVAVCLAGFACIQALVGLMSYRRTGKRKLLLISLAFIIFTIKGIYATLSAFALIDFGVEPDLYMLLVDLIIVILLYLSIIKE